MRNLCLLVLLAGLALGLTGGCRKKPANGREVVLARVNAATLTRQHLEQTMAVGPAKSQQVEMVRRWLNDELLYQEAQALRLVQDREIAAELKNLEREFLIEKFLERKLQDRTVLSDDEIKAYYTAHANLFVLDQPMVRIQQILVKDRATAQEILSLLKKDTPFGALARERSIDPSAELEGDLGYMTKWDLDPQLADACVALQVNAVSPIIKTGSGYHIVKLLDLRQKGEAQPLPLVHEQIVNYLKQQKQKEHLLALVRNLQKKNKVIVDFDALDTTEFPLMPQTGQTTDTPGPPASLTPTPGAETTYVP
jgi:parvulin-like peptidyl-prolyl isomerase